MALGRFRRIHGVQLDDQQAVARHVGTPLSKVLHQALLHIARPQALTAESEGPRRHHGLGALRHRTVEHPIVVEEGTDVEQIAQGNAVAVLEVAIEAVGITDVAPHEMTTDPFLDEVGFGRIERRLIEVRPHENEGVAVQVLAAQGFRADEFLEVEQQCAIATPHITDTAGLPFQWGVENRTDHLIEVAEVGAVGPATAPDVERAVDVDFGLARLRAPKLASIAEQELLRPEEGLDVGGRHAE